MGSRDEGDGCPALTSEMSGVFSRVRMVGHVASTRVSMAVLAPALVLVILFKLAISDGGRHLETLTLAQTAIYVALAIVVAGRGRRLIWTWPLIGMVAAVALTSVWSVRSEASVRELLLWGMYLGIAVLTASTLQSTSGMRRFLDAVIVVAGWLCLIALFMFWGANNPGMRWYSTFYWPNPFAAFLLLVLPLEFVRYLRTESRREALAHGAATVLLAIAFVLTYSRGAWFSMVVLLPLVVALLRSPSWAAALRRTVVLAGCVALAVVLLTRGAVPSPAASGVVGRAASVADTGDLSIQGRLAFWRAGLAMFRDHLLVGTGPGTFGAVHAAYQRDVRFYARDPHSLYVQTAAEMGLAGVVSLGALLSSIALLWRRALQQAWGREEYPLIVGVGLGLLAFFLHSGVDMDWMFPANPAMAFALVGVLLWYERGERRIGGNGRRTRGVPRMGAVLALVGAVVIAVSFQVAQRRFVEAQRFVWAGRWDLAAESYARAVRWNPLSARYLAARASALAQIPAFRVESEAALRRAIVFDRMNAAHPLQLAHLAMAQSPGPERRLEAETLLRQTLALDGLNYPEAYRLLAQLYREAGARDRAEEVYRDSTARYRGRKLAGGMAYLLLWPEVAALSMDWAAFLVSDGRPHEAAKVLHSLLTEDPTLAVAYLQLADVYARQGRLLEADSILRVGMERVPTSEDLWLRWRTLPPRRTTPYEL